MKRNLHKLSSVKYDVVIIGGGIYGVSTAWDSALRGLKVALIDKGDITGATSSNSLKTIHGGLRYLQSFDIKRMRESIHERAVLMKIAPHLVFPLPVIMPTYGYKMKSRFALSAALMLNDIIGFDRNRLSDSDKQLPDGRLIPKSEIQEYIPGYEKKGITGGALWYDCQCSNTERLSLSYACSATEMGADIANYVECTGFLEKDNTIRGIKAKDVLSGETFDIRGKIVINMSGPWIDDVLNRTKQVCKKKRFIHSSAMNIIVKRKLLNGCAAGLPAPYQYVSTNGATYKGHQVLFFAPWRDYTIIGTRHLPYYGDSADYKVSGDEIDSFLDTINQTYPVANLNPKDVTFFHGGLLPMTGLKPDSGFVKLENHYSIYDHAVEDRAEGLLTVVGVKYTTHRDVACKTVDLIFRKLNRKSPNCVTNEKPVAGGDVGVFSEYLTQATKKTKFDVKIIRHLVQHYGSRYVDVLNCANESSELMQKIPGSSEVVKAEVINGVRHEMALKLTDMILRRTDMGSAEYPGDEAIAETAKIMGVELSWNDDKIRNEINEAKAVYMPLN